MHKLNLFFLLMAFVTIVISCKEDEATPMAKDIQSATKVSIDRFSAEAGSLFVRDNTNGLPAANAPILFDLPPFITTGLGRTGAVVHYYNFDVQSTTASPIYVFIREGESGPLDGQNNVVATIPGDAGYNDFWQVYMVTVPIDYVANSLTSEDEILNSGHTITATTTIVNCPIVPFGSTAQRSKLPGTPSTLTLGWYEGQAVAYFNFDEAPLMLTNVQTVPVSPIYVMFNDNAAGPPSGFRTEVSNPMQTHNVLATIPGDFDYSPLWSVRVIDNIHFDGVTDLASATSVPSMAAGVSVNCPVVR